MSDLTAQPVPVKAEPSGFLGFTRAQTIGLVVMLAAIAVLPYIVYPIFLMRILTIALFACAFNLVIGYVGLLSIGHAIFWGMGAYLAGYALKFWEIDAVLAILIGGVVGAAFGLVMGFLAIRRSGMYFAMITLALAQMVYFVCVQAPFTGGENGMQRIPRSTAFGVVSLSSDMAMYALTAAVFVIGFLLIHRVIHSPFGQVMKAIRENEPRAISLGYRVQDYKLIAFVLSAAISGAAGATSSLVFGIATLEGVSFTRSGDVVLTTLLGGLGTVLGPVVGAVILTSMERYLAQFGSWVTVTQGLIFIVCVLVFRRGVVGEIAAKLKMSL